MMERFPGVLVTRLKHKNVPHKLIMLSFIVGGVVLYFAFVELAMFLMYHRLDYNLSWPPFVGFVPWVIVLIFSFRVFTAVRTRKKPRGVTTIDLSAIPPADEMKPKHNLTIENYYSHNLNPNNVVTDNQLKERYTASEIYKKINEALPIENAVVDDNINLDMLAIELPGMEKAVVNPITFRDCSLKKIAFEEITFLETFILERCTIQSAYFVGYVKAGMIMTDCEFTSDMVLPLFSWSGHNAIDKPIWFTNCTFHGFVNTEDAWFQGPVTITNCRFIKGTNLLSNKGQPNATHFDVTPVITDNEGTLDLNR
jgi:hypothetical protein